MGAHQPGVLHELELSRDVGVKTDEAYSPLLVGRTVRTVCASAPQDPVEAGRRDQIVAYAAASKTERTHELGERPTRSSRHIGIARVGAPDMRSEWADCAIRIAVECKAVQRVVG